VSAGWLGLSDRAWRLAVCAGIAIGAVYALSPLTVWFALAAFAIARWAEHGIDGDERRWLRLLLIAATVLRVLAVAVLFASANHTKTPFATFFGDEEFFIKRSISLRNLALGLPIHSADFIYAFDEVGQTSYLYLLAAIQVLVGPSPYGVHLVGIAFYLAAVVLLYRLVRRTLGRVPAFAGLTLLLFLPTLFAWSVSALKESAFLLLTASSVALVEVVVRGRTYTRRVNALLGIAVIIATTESLRRAGAWMTSASLVVGLAIAWIVTRPRVLLAAIVIVPIAVGAVFSRPDVQLRAFQAVKQAGDQHQGHINTIGYVYKTLDDRFYISALDLADMRFFEQARFVLRSLVSYVVVPLPWQAHSKALLAYMPEQMVWYLMVALVPFGFVCSLRRDPLVASLLLSMALISAILVAMVSGNVGTLVRHRGMVIPYIVWLAAVGASELWLRWHSRRMDSQTRMEPTWP
jgi:4-amino-4-deoxy-L-arabinose transferase-like glycosyltransferase